MNTAQAHKIATGKGFIAALDQSGGSTPKALGLWHRKDAWTTDEEMFALIHDMRARIIKSPAFTGDKVIGAILFERTMDGDIDGKPAPAYPVGEQGRGALPEDRQGPGRRGRRRAADEADAGP